MELVFEILGVAAIMFGLAIVATGININPKHKSPFSTDKAKYQLAAVCLIVSLVTKLLMLYFS